MDTDRFHEEHSFPVTSFVTFDLIFTIASGEGRRRAGRL